MPIRPTSSYHPLTNLPVNLPPISSVQMKKLERIASSTLFREVYSAVNSGQRIRAEQIQKLAQACVTILLDTHQEPPPSQVSTNQPQQPTQVPQQPAQERQQAPAESAAEEPPSAPQPTPAGPKSAGSPRSEGGAGSGSEAPTQPSATPQSQSKGGTQSLPQTNVSTQTASMQQTATFNQKSPPRNMPANPGAVFSPQKKDQITKEVATASYLLKASDRKDGTQEGNPKPIETLQTLKKLQELGQKLETLQQEAKQESSKHPSEQTNKNIQNTLTQCKKELQDLAAQLKQAGMEKKDKPPPHTPLEKQIATLRQKAEQVLTQARATFQEAAKSLAEKLRSPPSGQNQTASSKQEQTALARSQKQAEASPKNPTTQTPAQTKQGETAKDIKTAAQTTPNQTTAKGESTQNAEVKQATTPTMPSTQGNKPEDKGEKPPLLKSASDLQELVKKSDKKELRLPATIGVVYPMKGKKREQGLMPIAEKKTPAPNQPPNKDMPEEKRKKGGKTNEEQDSSVEETQYVQPMIFVPERNTIIGDPFNEKIKGEIPGIIIHVPPFLIGVTSIVNLQFAQWLNDAVADQTIRLIEPGIVTDLTGKVLCKTHKADPSSRIHVIVHGDQITFSSLENHEYYPVVQVSWYGAKAYCATYDLRLPNEQERETAAGMDLPGEQKSLKKFRYGFKNNEVHPSFANYRDKEDSDADLKILPVAFFNGQNAITKRGVTYTTENAYSPYGCYDMSGNVFEWTSDGSKTKKGIKGGSYLTPPEFLRVAARKTLNPETCAPDIGFRVALDIPSTLE